MKSFKEHAKETEIITEAIKKPLFYMADNGTDGVIEMFTMKENIETEIFKIVKSVKLYVKDSKHNDEFMEGFSSIAEMKESVIQCITQYLYDKFAE